MFCDVICQSNVCRYLYEYRTQAILTPSFYFFCSSIQEGVLFKRVFYLPKVKEIWDINPETYKAVELEEIIDIDEMENNELLVDNI